MGKAPGMGGIKIQMLKIYGEEESIDSQMSVFQAVWKVGRMPEGWTVAVTVLLYN